VVGADAIDEAGTSAEEAPRAPSAEAQVAASAAPPAPPAPGQDDWQLAAATGTSRREQAAGRPHVPSWIPGSAYVPSALLQEMIDWARAGAPNEACGLLAAPEPAEAGGVPSRFIVMRNAANSPYRYFMDPDEQLSAMLAMDERDEVVWGIFHSHVASKPEPSVTDIGLANYPDALYLICSLAGETPVMRAWAIVDGAVGEVVLLAM
jgi:[CysO sulfur-carrier protein]-S-L-cysteine hydrolase